MSRTATLVFDEYPDDSIDVLLSPIPMADYFDLLADFDAIQKASTRDGWFAFFRKFGDLILQRWTFPEEPNGDGMVRRDINLSVAIVTQWVKAVRDVPVPLPLTSSAGTGFGAETSPSNSPAPSS